MRLKFEDLRIWGNRMRAVRWVALMLMAVLALGGVACAEDSRADAKKKLDMYLSTRPLPPDIVSGATSLFDAMCDREVAPAKALALTEKLVDNSAGRVADVLKFVKDSKQKGDALAKSVEAKIAEK